ncbi:putative Ribonuclease Y [Cocos nucifera]|uniref:Putative Ribonuclease Y n=1 Tax=Cocos nucifera TaxID=13894 RepID=A0A8K0IWY1_COCNU|nr:putative Ribonuclease Y [Cocos nucifera]
MEQSPNFIKAKPNHSSNNNKPPKARKVSLSILVISLPVLYVSLLNISPSTLFKDTTFWFLMSNSIIIIIAADSGMFSSSNETNDLYDEFIEHSKARSACLVAELPPETSTIERPKELVLLAPSQSDVVVDESIVVRENSVLGSQKPVNKTVAMKDKSLPQLGVELEKSLVVHEEPLHRSVMEKKDRHRMEEVEHSKLLLQRSATEKRNPHRFLGSEHSNLPFRRSATEKRNYPNLGENEYSKLSDEELNKRVDEFIRRFNREIRLQLGNE